MCSDKAGNNVFLGAGTYYTRRACNICKKIQINQKRFKVDGLLEFLFLVRRQKENNLHILQMFREKSTTVISTEDTC